MVPKNLTNINIAQTVTQIGAECFYGCTSLSTFDNRGIVSLGAKSFAECRNLKEISIENLTSLAEGCFLNCTKLSACNLPNITSIGKEAFKNCQSLIEYNITNGVTSIEDSAFEGCFAISSIIIPNNVTDLGFNVFKGCTSLTSISIGSGLSYLPWVFEGCSNLSDIRIEDATTTLKFGYTGQRNYKSDYNGQYIRNTESYAYVSSAMFVGKNLREVYIGRNITTESYCFYEGYQSGAYMRYRQYYLPNPPFSGSKIESITIGSLVTDLAMCKSAKGYDYWHGEWNASFQNCVDLNSVILQTTATYIPKNMFSGCCEISSLDIPNSVTEIGGYAFSGCTGLKYLSLGSNLTTIENNAFEGCDSLIEIKIKNSNPPIYNTGFSSTNYINTKVYVPTGSLKKYQEVEPWRNFWNIYEKDELISWFDVGDIKYSVISSNKVEIVGNSISETKDLCLKNKVEFYGKVCDVVSISDASFKNCSYLSSVQIEEGIMHIGKSAFENCGKLKTVIIPSDMQSIGIAAFKNCLSLDNVILPPSIAMLSSECFSGCKSLCSISMPPNMQSIGIAAFKNCLLLDNVILPSSIAMLSSECFSGCESLSSISIPPSVVTFGNNVFSGCTGLRELIIEDGQEPIIFPNGAYDTATGIQKKNVNGRTIQFKIQYYKPLFSKLPIEKLYIGRNLSRDSRYTINGDGGVDYYLITSYDAPFSGLSKLKELSIGENVDVLGPNEEYIPEVDLYVTPGSFKNCSSIQTIEVKNPTPPTGAEFTNSVYSKANLIVSKSSINEYNEAVGWKNFVNLMPKKFLVKFIIDNDIYTCEEVPDGDPIPLPIKEGYTIVWEDVPEVMPKHDITIVGTSIINKYLATFTIDGEVIVSDSIEYGSTIVAPEVTGREGYTFSGWNEVPETMPAEDVVFNGFFTINKYLVTFKIGDEVISSESLEYGANIVVPVVPEKKGHSFNGWGEVAKTVPASDLTYEGSYSVNSYLLTYMVDGEIVQSDSIAYGTKLVTPKAPTKEGHTFSGWGKVPATMPAEDTTISGFFTPNTYKVYYYVDGKLVHTAKVTYGEAIPEYVYEPTIEGEAFVGWEGETYETMPAHNLIYKAEIEIRFITLAIDQYGSGTFCSIHALDFSEVAGLKAYVATGYNTATGEVTLTRVMTAKPGEGLFLKGKPGDYEVPTLKSSESCMQNLLVGTLRNAIVNATSNDGFSVNYEYTAKGEDTAPLFYRITDNITLETGKAYLQLPKAWLGTGATRAAIGLRFDDEEMEFDDEEQPADVAAPAVIYDLQGRRVANPTKGVFIVNGKKVVFK